jgi:threonine dehydrogenase-like Zn-dependent dehydrogenase
VRSLVFSGPGQIGWSEVPDPPEPAPSDAVVRPLAVARCDLDLPMAAFGIFPGPFTVGHEAVAEVVAVGEEVRSHRVGDRVSVPFQVSCGDCAPCRGARFAACTTYRAPAGSAFGFGERGGGHGGAVSDLLTVPAADHLLLTAPSDVSSEALCTLPDNVLDAYRAVGPPLRDRPGADVLVVGGAAASIGLYAVHLAVALGAGAVRYADQDADRCATAEALGARVHHGEGWPRRFDRAAIVVENSGTPEGLSCALRSTEDYGTCTTVAINFAPTVPVPLLEMYTRGVTLVVSRADSRLHLAAVLTLAADGVIDPLLVPTDVVDWADAADAWLAPCTKLVLRRT